MKLEKSDLQLETIMARISREELDLQPSFQRGEIWDRKRKQRLIDTVLRDWYVPAVHVVQGDGGSEVVLDGQQRLASIRDFLEDAFPVDGRIEPHNESIASLHGLKFSKLPGPYQRAVRRFVISVVTLYEYDPDEPNELFFRLNQSYNLTPSEKRNALHGAARNQIKGLVHELEQLGLLDSDKVGFSNGRLAYDDIVARTCVAVESNTIARHINNNTVEEVYRSGEFAMDTLTGVRNAGLELLKQIDLSEQRVRFNKGTLQTWLIYCYWAMSEGQRLPRTLLATFEDERKRYKSGDLGETREDPLLRVIGIYDDRASYRVTDVSSVQARDLAVHVFSLARFGMQQRRDSSTLLHSLRLAEERNESATNRLFFDFIATSGWGEQLVDDDVERVS